MVKRHLAALAPLPLPLMLACRKEPAGTLPEAAVVRNLMTFWSRTVAQK